MMLCDADFEDLFPDLFGPAARGPDLPPAPHADQGKAVRLGKLHQPASATRLDAKNQRHGR